MDMKTKSITYKIPSILDALTCHLISPLNYEVLFFARRVAPLCIQQRLEVEIFWKSFSSCLSCEARQDYKEKYHYGIIVLREKEGK